MIECANCGQDFKPDHASHHLCVDCFGAWQRDHNWAICAGCGAQFARKGPDDAYCHLCWRDRQPAPRSARQTWSGTDPQ